MPTNTQYYDPEKLEYPFKSPGRGIMTPGNEDLLAKTLEVRLAPDSKLRPGPYSHWGKNTAAVKIFPTIEQEARGVKPILAGAISDPTLYLGKQAGYPNPHSETFSLLEAYDKLIDTLYPDNGVLLPPREYYRQEPTLREQNASKFFKISKEYPQYPRQVIDRFRNDPSPFKNFVTNRGHTIQAISERIPCKGKSGCQDFLNRAIPDGSEVGHLIRQGEGEHELEQAYTEHLIPWYKKYNEAVAPALNSPYAPTPNSLPYARDINREIEEKIAARKNKGRNSFNTPHAALINAQRNSFGMPSPNNTASISKGLVGESNFWSPSDTESYSPGYSSTDDYESNLKPSDFPGLAQVLFGSHLRSPSTTTPSSPFADISSLTNSPTVSSYGSQLASLYPATPGFEYNTLYNTPIVNEYQGARNLNPIPFDWE